MTPDPFAASFANGIPAFDNPPLACWRRIPPIRLLSFGELTFGDLNQLVIGLHDRIVRMRHFEAAMTLGSQRAHDQARISSSKPPRSRRDDGPPFRQSRRLCPPTGARRSEHVVVTPGSYERQLPRSVTQQNAGS